MCSKMCYQAKKNSRNGKNLAVHNRQKCGIKQRRTVEIIRIAWFIIGKMCCQAKKNSRNSKNCGVDNRQNVLSSKEDQSK